MAVDPTFGLNKFGKPKILTESETLVFNIMMILMSKPGFLPSMPEIGMDIYSLLYSLEGELDLNALKSKVAYQCSDFLENVGDGSFDITERSYNGNKCLIFTLPVIITDKYQNLVLGVSLNSVGEMIFNYTFNVVQTL